MLTFIGLLPWIMGVVTILLVVYLLSYHNKLNKLKPSAQRCYHMDKLPSITSFLPKFILFSIIKSQGTLLNYCQLISPNKSEQNKVHKNRPIHTINTLNPTDSETTETDEQKDVYEYFSQIEVMIDSISIDPLHLVSYNKLFSTKHFEHISICYLDAMRFTLTPYIICKDEFPLSPLGLIHIATEITMYQHLSINNKYEITTSLTEIRDTKKGIEVDITTCFYLLKTGSNESKMVYQSIETLLSRNKRKIRKYKAENMDKLKRKLKQNQWKVEFDVNNKKNKENEIVKKDIDICYDVGMCYAKVSGDFSPHHLTKWSAFIVGYKSGIVHGMWSLQKCITEIKDIYCGKKDMFIYKYPMKVVSTFKLPIYMPSKVKLITNYYSKSNDYLTFALVSKNETLPHVLGSIIVESQ